MSRPLGTLTGAVLGGLLGFAFGFFGPLLWAPGANQGPLLGIFITGPIGVIAGAALGQRIAPKERA